MTFLVAVSISFSFHFGFHYAPSTVVKHHQPFNGSSSILSRCVSSSACP